MKCSSIFSSTSASRTRRPGADAPSRELPESVFAVPPARRDLLDRVLDEAIEEALGDYLSRLSSDRWAALQLAGVRGLFRNLRDVRRYASAVIATGTR